MIKYIVVAIVVLIIHFCFPLVKVVGESMSPTYKDGEFHLAYKVTPFTKPKVGDVVVVKLESNSKYYVIKRVARISNFKKSAYILGDNGSNSYDSRYYGDVPIKSIKFILFVQRSKVVEVIE